MKAFVTVLILVVSVAFGSSAQRMVQELEMKNGKAQAVFSTADTYGNMAYIFQGSKSIQVNLLDPSYQVLSQFLINRDEAEKRNEVIGVTLGVKNVVVYLYDTKERNLAALIIDRFTGTYTFRPSIGTLQKAEFFLKSFEMGGKFYVLVVPQYKNTVLLFESEDGNDFVVKNYEINFPTFYAKLSSKNDELNHKTDSPVGIEKISYAVENNIKSTYPSKKLYTFGDKIYMTFDEAAHTHLVIIDPKSNESVYRKLNFSLSKTKNTNPRQGNSFLYMGDLFRVTMNEEQLNMIVITIDSMQMLKSYTIYAEQPIPILNGHIRQDGNDIEMRIIKNTPQFFKRIQKAKLSIAVNDLLDGRYEAEIGGYEEVVSYRNAGPGYSMSPGMSMGFGMGMGPMMMGYGYPMYYDPFYYPGYYPYGGGSTVTSIRSTYFQTLLDIDHLTHIQGNVPKTLREKLNDYEADVFRKNNPELLNVIPTYGHKGLVLGYYAKNRSKYILVEFNR
jgi:hypothetical protein